MGSFCKGVVCILLIVNIGAIQGISVEEDLSLTLSQKNALDKFRARVMPLLTRPWQKQDLYLIRWLRARNFDLDSAERMLKVNLRWRKENNIDNILKEDWTEIQRDFPATLDSEDKTGRPLGTIDIYQWDIRRGALQGKGQKMLRYMDYLMENGTMQVFDRLEQGKNATQWVTLGIPLWIQFIQSLENNYPGWLDEYILVDAPSTISIILDAIRPFLTRQTRDAFRIFGPNRNKWMPYLDAKIERSERRPQYGGTKPQPHF